MKSSDKKYRLLSIETLGLLIVLVSIIGIISLFAGKYLLGELGEILRGFFFGVFGYLSYVIFIVSTTYGVITVAGFKLKLKISAKNLILSIIALFSLVCILQLSFTKFTGSYSSYLSTCYHNGFSKPSLGGVFVALILGLLCDFISVVGTYILFSITLIVSLVIFILGFTKNLNLKNVFSKKENPTQTSNLNIPFGFSNFGQVGGDGLNIPFSSNSVSQSGSFKYQEGTITSQEVFNKLDALRKGESYQDIMQGSTISSYSQESQNSSYKKGVSQTIPNKTNDSYSSSYQDAFLDESTPSSKMFIPKDTNGENPYTIKDTKVSVDDGLQESATVSIFDKILDIKPTFEDEYKKAKEEQARIIKDQSFDVFEEDTTVSTQQLTDTTAQTPSFSYSDPEPVVNEETEVELQTLNYEIMKDYDFVPPPLSLFKSYEANEDKDKFNEFVNYTVDMVIEIVRQKKKQELIFKEIQHGPTFTRFEFELPMLMDYKDLEGLADEFSLRLATKSPVRIAHISGTNRVGIEVANKQRLQVGLKEVISDEEFIKLESKQCPFVIGKDVTGKSLFLELAELTHILLAGTSGSGKSVFVTALLVSLMCKVSPKDLRMVICDPKGVDFIAFGGAPHLLIDEIVVETQKIDKVLGWAVAEMERRYSILQENRVAKIADYNKIMQGKDHMARILIFVDEFADLVSQEGGKEIMNKVQRLAQKARAAGIHLLLATQRPTVDIVSGTIKSNLSTRIALKVQNGLDSRTILDEMGAENLLVHGDLMFFSQTNSQIQRAQGPYISSDELFDVLNFIRDKNPAIFDERLKRQINKVASSSSGTGDFVVGGGDDKDFKLKVQALQHVIETKKSSISYLQRAFRIGFNKAALIHDWMINEGYITALEGNKAQINITMEEFKQKFGV